QATLPCLVDQPQLVAANALLGLSSNLARLCGAPLGGVVAAAWGLNGIVLLDSASFLLSCLLIGRVDVRNGPASAPHPEGTAHAWTMLWHEWIAGLRLVRRQRTLAILFILSAVQALCQGLFLVLFVVFVSTILKGGAPEIGWLRGVQAIGGL